MFSVSHFATEILLPLGLPSFKEHFPEVSATVTVVRAHWSVVALYEILKPWLTEHLQQKEGQWEKGWGRVVNQGLSLD